MTDDFDEIARDVHRNFPSIGVDEARAYVGSLAGGFMHIQIAKLSMWVLARVHERSDEAKHLKRRVAELEQEVERMKVRGAL